MPLSYKMYQWVQLTTNYKNAQLTLKKNIKKSVKDRLFKHDLALLH